jgi:hypothetical protein
LLLTPCITLRRRVLWDFNMMAHMVFNSHSLHLCNLHSKFPPSGSTRTHSLWYTRLDQQWGLLSLHSECHVHMVVLQVLTDHHCSCGWQDGYCWPLDDSGDSLALSSAARWPCCHYQLSSVRTAVQWASWWWALVDNMQVESALCKHCGRAWQGAYNDRRLSSQSVRRWGIGLDSSAEDWAQ